jgi:serine/threonine protein kinase
MELAPGMRIGRKLHLVRQVGEGGMASVWVAEDRSGRGRFAVKVLASDLLMNPEAVERFTMEANAIASIKSPFVPKAHAVGSLPDGTPYTVMDLLDGVDLDVYLRKHGPLSLGATSRLVSNVAAALAAAHGLGIVHRDVKAENVFVKGGGEDLMAKLVDFGIAKVPLGNDGARPTQMGALIGTPGYMSQEQLASPKDVDHRADLWSLGVVAYLALMGRLPFVGATFPAVCVAVHQGIFDLPSKFRPELPTELDAWFIKALSHDPNDRFQTAGEMADALAALATTPRALLLCTQDELDADEVLSVPSVPGLSRTRWGSSQPRRSSHIAALALCSGFVVYTVSARSRVPRWLSNHASAGWSSVEDYPQALSERLRLSSAMPLRTPRSPTAPVSSPSSAESPVPIPLALHPLVDGELPDAALSDAAMSY